MTEGSAAQNSGIFQLTRAFLSNKYLVKILPHESLLNNIKIWSFKHNLIPYL